MQWLQLHIVLQKDPKVYFDSMGIISGLPTVERALAPFPVISLEVPPLPIKK